MLASLGFQEVALILVLALLIFGPRQLPQIGRTIGRTLAEFRRASNDLKRTINAEMMEEEMRAADPREIVRETVSEVKAIGSGLVEDAESSAAESSAAETSAAETSAADEIESIAAAEEAKVRAAAGSVARGAGPVARRPAAEPAPAEDRPAPEERPATGASAPAGATSDPPAEDADR